MPRRDPDHALVKVLQVVTLVTPDGAYGGPVRVAFNQAREIRRRGHEVTIAGACSGYEAPPASIDDTTVYLRKVRRVIPFVGVSGFACPAIVGWLFRHRREVDVVHVHLGRDLVTMPAAFAALLLGKRLVLQTHGMIDESNHPLAPVLDRFLTRPLLRRADVVLYLTPYERQQIVQVEPSIRSMLLPNAVPVAIERANPGDGERDVLFLARMHERKRPVMFVQAAAKLLEHGVTARFSMVGPDGGQAGALEDAIRRAGRFSSAIVWEGPLPPDRTDARLARASIYVLPAIDEPFAMSVLEAMAVGLPVIVTESCGLANVVLRSGAGIVVDHTEEALVAAIRTLLDDADLRVRYGDAGRRTAREEFSMDVVGSALLAIYAPEQPNVTE